MKKKLCIVYIIKIQNDKSKTHFRTSSENMTLTRMMYIVPF